MTTTELKVMYPKLRSADNYVCVLVTWLIDQMTTMDKMQ